MIRDERFPTGMPERRAEPRQDVGDRWRLPRAAPKHHTCVCGKPAWRFPEPGVGFCGFCKASAEDLAERKAQAIDKEDVADEIDARREREAAE